LASKTSLHTPLFPSAFTLGELQQAAVQPISSQVRGWNKSCIWLAIYTAPRQMEVRRDRQLRTKALAHKVLLSPSGSERRQVAFLINQLKIDFEAWDFII
jgi:hypothetical protein